jgi:predicted dehydrogenase
MAALTVPHAWPYAQRTRGVAMPKKLNIAVIGAGMIGDVHVDRIRRDGRGEVSWLVARTDRTVTEKLAKHGVPRGSTDYRDVLDDDDVDAVVIASPPNTHLAILLDALDAGKHVLLEKPMVTTRPQLRRLLAAVKRHPKQIVLECSCRHARLQPKFRFVKSIIDGGEIGKVYHIHHNHLMRSTFIDWNPRGAWALRKAQAGGGPFFDWGVYDLSFHLGLLGDKPQIAKVHAFTKRGLKVFADPEVRSDVEEHGAAHLEFGGGLTYYYERGAGVHLTTANETRICGTRGGLRFAFCSWDAPEVEVFTIDKHGHECSEVRKVDMSAHTDDDFELTRHFFDCVLEHAKPLMPVALAAKHLDILFRIFESAARRSLGRTRA